MVLRDDLGAARARIEALERELAAAREAGEVAASDVAERGRRELNEARARIRELEDLNRATDRRYEKMRDAKYALDERAEELENEVKSLREQLKRTKFELERVERVANARLRSPNGGGSDKPTLEAHNRAFSPLEPTGTIPSAGVRCADCARGRRDVEVLRMTGMREAKQGGS